MWHSLTNSTKSYLSERPCLIDVERRIEAHGDEADEEVGEREVNDHHVERRPQPLLTRHDQQHEPVANHSDANDEEHDDTQENLLPQAVAGGLRRRRRLCDVVTAVSDDIRDDVMLVLWWGHHHSLPAE